MSSSSTGLPVIALDHTQYVVTAHARGVDAVASRGAARNEKPRRGTSQLTGEKSIVS